MRKLLITMIAFISTLAMGVDIMLVGPATNPIEVLRRGQIPAGGGNTNYGTCSIGVRATVATVDTANVEDQWMIWVSHQTGASGLIFPAPDPLNGGTAGVEEQGWAGSGHANLSWTLKNGAGAVTAKGQFQYNPDRGDNAVFYARMGLKAAAPATLSGTDEQPIWHLDKATYDGGEVIVRMSGDFPPGSPPAKLSLFQVHDNGAFGPAWGIGEPSTGNAPRIINLAGNGMVEATFPLSLIDGTENLCEHLGAP